MNINTTNNDKQIKFLYSIATDTNIEPRRRLLALGKVTQLQQEKAELLQTKIVSSLSELELNGPMRINGQYID